MKKPYNKVFLSVYHVLYTPRCAEDPKLNNICLLSKNHKEIFSIHEQLGVYTVAKSLWEPQSVYLTH